MSQPLKVLIVEDSEDDAKLALRALRGGGFEPTSRRVQTAADLKTALAQERWDAVISDFNMPGFTGMDALNIFRATGLDIPFILISGHIGETAAVHAIKAGASDCIMKKTLTRLPLALDRELKQTQVRAGHRRTQEDLTESEMRFRQMAENISDVFFLINLDSSQIYYVSPAYEQLWGRTSASLYANPGSWVDAIHPDDRDHAYTKFNEGRSTGFDYEYRVVRPDGEIRWIHLRGFPILDNSGNPYRTAGIAADITQRKQAADELRRSESLKAAILRSSLDCLITIDHRGQIVEFNPAAEATFGWPREHALGKDMADLIIPARFRDAHRRGIARYLATGIGSFLGKRIEFEAIRADGTEFPIELAITAIGAESEPMFTGFIRDITARKQAASELRESERRFSDMLGNVEMVSIMLDANARIIYCNDYLLRLTGWRSEEVIGGDWFELFLPPDLTDLRDFHAALLANQPEAWHHENHILTRSGGRRLIRWNNSVLRSGVGDVIGTASIGEDITEQKRTESGIKRLNRVYAVLSQINALIVRVRDRDELYREACRIVVEAGGLRMSMIGIVDRRTTRINPVASAGKDDALLTAIKGILCSPGAAPNTMVARAIREKKAVVSNDSQNDSRVLFAGQYTESGVRSIAILPLIVADEAVGALALYAGESQFFHEEEMTLLTGLAGDISFALEHIGKEERIARLSRIETVMSAINSAIVRVGARQALFDEACRVAVEHGNFGAAWIGLFDSSAMETVEVASSGRHLHPRGASVRSDVSRSPGVASRAIREKRVVFDNDITAPSSAGGERRALSLQAGFRSMVALPFMVEGAVVAHLSLYAKEPDFFNEDELKLLTDLAGNISFALAHIGKEEKIVRLSRIHAVSGGINALIVRVRDRQELFDAACRITVEGGQFPLAWIGVLDPATQDVTPVAWAGENAEAIARGKSSARKDLPGGKGAVGRAIRERGPVFNNDLSAHAFGGPRIKEILRLGYKSLVTLPLFDDQTVVGTLTMYAREANFFDAEELRLLTELAGNISFALGNISRQQKLDKLARIRAVSSEINAAIIRIHDREALLRETSRIAVEHGKFELVWIALVDTERQKIEPVAWTGFSREAAHAVTWSSVNATQGPLAEAIRTRSPTVRDGTQGDAPLGSLRKEALLRGCSSVLCLPLIVEGNVAGLIALYSPEAGFFDEEELRLLTGLSGDISFALQAIEKQKQLDYLAYYDVLTGLANRQLFLDRVGQYLRSAVSGGHKLAVGLVDLERFKNINDSLGRPAGDSLLKQVAEWLPLHLGDANLVARMGADHFAVVLPEVKQESNLARLVEKMVASFLEHPFRLEDAVFRVAAKVGVAVYPDDGADAGTLFKNAEAALKKAKASGERYLFYTQKMSDAVAGKLMLENQLRQALDNEEFVLHYQPKVSLETGKITSAEALIRWNDPRTGLVPPGRFIPVLEETGLIYDVGRWALRKALEDYLRWRGAGLAAVRIAVNVSPLQLRNRGFIAEIEQVIGIHEGAAGGLELELTESLIMEDVKHSIASLQAIRAMGVRIAIDDFGTGFSSLSYLSRLPVDTLKIDRSFVIDMTVGPEGLALVSTIINLAHSLKLKVVAEGVETEEQSRLLRLLDCDEMQGYLFSKPVPAEIFETRFLAPPPAGTSSVEDTERTFSH